MVIEARRDTASNTNRKWRRLLLLARHHLLMSAESAPSASDARFRSFFPFADSPLAIAPESMALLDRTIVWLVAYRHIKGYAKLPPPAGTCLELFMLVEEFQVVQQQLREQTADWAKTPLMGMVTAQFLATCPVPPPFEAEPPAKRPKTVLNDALVEEELREPGFDEAILLPPDHCPAWNPIHLPTAVFHELKKEILEAQVMLMAMKDWRSRF